MKLRNKVAIITGGNQGFGLAVAKSFASEGASLVLAARDSGRLQQSKTEIEKEFRTPVEIISADVSNAEENARMVDLAMSSFGRIDIFVANAGIYGPKGPIESVDWSDWSYAIDVNLKGPILGCRSVVPIMKSSGKGKIIILSGGGATKPMPYLSAYAVSKAGLVRFMETLAEELSESNIDVNAVAPGALNTRLLDEILEAGPEAVGRSFYDQSVKQRETGGTSLQKGSDLCVFLASEESNKITGKLISAVWDPWQSFQLHLSDLRNSDIYTLRRIVPEDRNILWQK
jgi:3-oxoacyl-[acyl-carrier protein] reductase